MKSFTWRRSGILLKSIIDIRNGADFSWPFMVCILPKDSFSFCSVRKILSKGRLECGQTLEKMHFLFFSQNVSRGDRVFLNPGKNVCSGYRVKEKRKRVKPLNIVFVASMHVLYFYSDLIKDTQDHTFLSFKNQQNFLFGTLRIFERTSCWKFCEQFLTTTYLVRGKIISWRGAIC